MARTHHLYTGAIHEQPQLPQLWSQLLQHSSICRRSTDTDAAHEMVDVRLFILSRSLATTPTHFLINISELCRANSFTLASVSVHVSVCLCLCVCLHVYMSVCVCLWCYMTTPHRYHKTRGDSLRLHDVIDDVTSASVNTPTMASDATIRRWSTGATAADSCWRTMWY